MQEKQEVQYIDEPEEETTLLVKFRSIAVTVMLLMISMGQWNDTKDVAISAYEEIVSRWTNNIQYEKLAKLRIGYSESYIKTFFGEPQVIKAMSSMQGGVFSYYSTPKYLLTTATKDDQLLGFSVLSINDDFIAPIVYSDKKLNESTLNTYLPDADNYATDYRNSIYFLVVSELGQQHMFYDFSIGLLKTSILTDALANKIRTLNERLDRGDEPLLEDLEISPLLKPNYYSVSEFSSEIMHESILSKYEMKALFTY
jgi:hypothetical protein